MAGCLHPSGLASAGAARSRGRRRYRCPKNARALSEVQARPYTMLQQQAPPPHQAQLGVIKLKPNFKPELMFTLEFKRSSGRSPG
jgi:hypothetical protein